MPKGTPGRAPCSVDGCERLTAAQQLCSVHYSRWLRTASSQAGDPEWFESLRRTRGDSWSRRAACRGLDPRSFYTIIDDKPVQPKSEAVRACASCVVADECLLSQLVFEATYYIGLRSNYYGGTTPTERRDLVLNPARLELRIRSHRERLEGAA